MRTDRLQTLADGVFAIALTGLVAEYLLEPEQSSAAAVTYGLVFTLLSLSFTLIWLQLARREDLAHPDLRPRLPMALRRSLVGPAVYGVSTVVALVSAPLAFVLFALAAVYFGVSGRRTATAPASGAEPAPAA